MEEVTKESGHRPSVSMPSLDSADEFPAHTDTSDTGATENSDSVFATTDSYAATTDALTTSEPSSVSTTEERSEGIPVSLADTADSVSVENSQSVEELSTPTLTEEASRESLVESGPTHSFAEENSAEPLIDTPTGDLIEEASTEALIDSHSGDLTQEALDESQGEEDPSIAIDQFIKKIADEQLSSKRIEERQEEEAEEQQKKDNQNLNLEESKATTENINESKDESLADTTTTEDIGLETDPMKEQNNTQTEGDAHPEPSSLENTLTGNSSLQTETSQSMEDDKLEPMEVDSDIHNEPTQKLNPLSENIKEKGITVVEEGVEQMQMESIEEIQKEIDRIPPKKIANNEDYSKTPESGLTNEKDDATSNSNNGNHATENESIEQILGGDLDEPKVGIILKNALEKEIKAPSIEDSGEVAKDAVLIEKAQEDIKKLDVLVCGECHNTFYYVQDFTEHKKGRCPLKSTLTGSCEAESKPQVWGFVLWKIKQTKDLIDNIPSSWSIYQKWCKLPQADKNAWITAGQSIQFASKIGNARITEVRPSKPAKQTIVHKITESSPPPLEFVDNNKENSSGMVLENSTSNIIKRGLTKPVRLNNDVTILPSSKNASTNSEMISNSNTAVRTTKVVSMQKDEFVVEKIMAKRFNPRKKTWEYNIKWENFGHDSNTWEPISNLSHCKKLLEQFEEQLKRMKEEKAKQAAQSPKGRGRPANPKPKSTTTNFVPIAPKSIATISNVVGGVSEDYAGGSSNRPQRFSKQKAMSQVKQWCGNISDDDGSGTTGLKRKYETDDSDEDFDDKKIKLEEDSDYSDKEVKPKISIKKVTSTPTSKPKTIQVKNGNTTQQILPSNILIPDANGVVRINQKQLPALSSGVYIMSKTAGIIKLDSTTSKVATSGGQTIVKVAPKIGQTQIKIVKKDGNTTKQIIQVSPKPPIGSGPVRITPVSKINSQKLTPKIRREVRKPPPLTEPASKFVQKKVDITPPPKPIHESDSDDGLEPLPFPEPDEPLPDLEEEKDNGFVLDPETGKIAGIEYIDKPVVIKEEPQPVPPTTNELENIVKMAAADLSSESEDDYLIGDQDDRPIITKFAQERETKLREIKSIVKPLVKAPPKPAEVSTPVVRKVVKYTVAGQGAVKSEDSATLNKSLVQGQQKPTVSGAGKPVIQQRRVVQQKVINQMVSQRTPGQQARTVVRHVIEPTRPGQSGNINVIRKTVTSTPKPKFNLSPQKPLPSPLQPTRTYSAMGGIRQTNAPGTGSKVQVYSAKSNVSASQTTGQVQGGVRRIGNTVVRSTSSNQATTQRQQAAQQYATQKTPVTRIVQRVITSPKKAGPQQALNSSAQQIQTKSAASAKPRTVINMPSLTEDDTPLLSTQQKSQTASQQAQQKMAPKAAVKKEPALKVETPIIEEPTETTEAMETGTSTEQTDWSSFTMADGDNPIYVTGDDGTIYQVAGQNEQGQTILITQGADGQQQCLLVTNEIGEMAPDDPQTSTNTASTANQEVAESEQTAATVLQGGLAIPTTLAGSVDESLQTPLQIKTDTSEMEGIEDGVQDQVVAQVVRAEPPSPGGTHKVVVMLPDGNLMVTQVSPEEYASLELE